MTNYLTKPKEKNIEKKVDELLNMSEEALSVNYDEALSYAQKALELLQNHDNYYKKCYVFYYTAKIYYYKGQFKTALKYVNKAEKIVEHIDDIFLIHKVYNITGVLYFSLGEYISALNHFLTALETLKADEEKYKKDIASLYLNISNIYFINNDYDQSIEILDEAVVVFKELKKDHNLFLCYNTYGNIYTKKDDYELADFYYYKGLTIAKKLNHLEKMASIYNNLSYLAEKNNKFDKALELVFKSLDINKKLSREAIIALDYRRIGTIYFYLKRYSEGIEYLENSLKVSKELNNKNEVIITLDEFATACAKAKMWELAYKYREEYSQLRNSVFNDEKTKILSEMQVKHQLERKKRETELLRASEKQIKDYADRLEESNKDLERFARVASHDMKEPLRMVKSYLSLISRKIKKYDDKTLNEFLGFAVDGADRMQQLITEMLKLAQVQTKEHVFKQVDLNDVMFVVKRNLQRTVIEKNVDLEIAPLPVVQGNQALLTQLFQNLITNGIKYNREENPIIKIQHNETSDAHHFEIIDNGIGIKKEYFEKIFEMLTRLHNRTEFEGTGIGLATCQRIVERHKGKIWVSSQEGKGSNFQFFIPKHYEENKHTAR